MIEPDRKVSNTPWPKDANDLYPYHCKGTNRMRILIEPVPFEANMDMLFCIFYSWHFTAVHSFLAWVQFFYSSSAAKETATVTTNKTFK